MKLIYSGFEITIIRQDEKYVDLWNLNDILVTWSNKVASIFVHRMFILCSLNVWLNLSIL